MRWLLLVLCIWQRQHLLLLLLLLVRLRPLLCATLLCAKAQLHKSCVAVTLCLCWQVCVGGGVHSLKQESEVGMQEAVLCWQVCSPVLLEALAASVAVTAYERSQKLTVSNMPGCEWLPQ